MHTSILVIITQRSIKKVVRPWPDDQPDQLYGHDIVVWLHWSGHHYKGHVKDVNTQLLHYLYGNGATKIRLLNYV